ncbi:3-oxoacyl-[acyl-carrier-protein] synthase III C-terminal domain-containing protein [Sorangium sp. So ce1036]|uniref:3-oxoacyl-ACP synthase III family protein n=1 Tax=Sorangium sp. So ce1036 TaxID=3133328 RepID=UPI003F0726C9
MSTPEIKQARSAGITALVAVLPKWIRTNEYWRKRYPERYARAPGARPRAAAPVPGVARSAYDIEMDRYLDDPFLGAVERRVVGPGESSVTLAVAAARQALETAGLTPGDIDQLVSSSIFPDRVGIGDAGFISKQLKQRGGCFHVEATCNGSLVSLLIASAFVRAGMKRRVLVTAACNFSRAIDESYPTSPLTGDGAGAFVISEVEPGYGLLGTYSLQTGESCGTWILDTAPDETGTTEGGRKIRLRSEPTILHVFRKIYEPSLHQAVNGALEAANVRLEDIDFFIFSASVAWFSPFCVRALGIDPARTLDTYPLYANMANAMLPVGLHRAALTGRLRRDDLVLIYGFGGQSESTAAVLRWGDVALGPEPPAGEIVP